MEKKFSVVRAIVDCNGMTDREKLNNIQSYLLGWTDEETALRIVEANRFATAETIWEYAETSGKEAAADLVLLYGPDAFRSYDEYDAILCEMEGGLNHDPDRKI